MKIVIKENEYSYKLEEYSKEKYTINNSIFLSIFSVFDCYRDKTTNTNKYYYKNDIRLLDYIKIAQNYKITNNEDFINNVERVMENKITKDSLFSICPSTFKKNEEGKVIRKMTNVKNFTKLVQLDLDVKNEEDCSPERIEDIKESLMTDFDGLSQHIVFCSKSVSGKGVYCYVLFDTDDTDIIKHCISKFYKAISEHLGFKSEKTCDTSITDITTRLRYFAPDNNLIINNNVVPCDTSRIKIQKSGKVEYNYNNVISHSGWKIKDILQQTYNKYLKDYHQGNKYLSGFDTQSISFYKVVFMKGVPLEDVINYTTEKFKNLYNYEKGMKYLPLLLEQKIPTAYNYYIEGLQKK